MRYLVSMLSFFILGCQLIDPIVVPIDRTARNVNTSSSLYTDKKNNTKVGFKHQSLVWEKKF